jgi:drug/metabolite transporter (DMT)-like permease
MLNGLPGDNKRAMAVLMLAASAVLWSMGGLLIKSVDWDPFAIAGARSAIAALVVTVMLRRPRFIWSVPQVGGAVAYSATVILFVLANKMTTAANAIVLQYACPVYVALLGLLLLKERVSLRAGIMMCIALAGIVLFFFDRLTPAGFRGNILALVSGITMAFMVVFLRMQKYGSPTESILLGNVVTVVICAPHMSAPLPSPAGMVSLVLLGVFQLGLSYVLYSRAIKQVPALDAILIPVIEPVLNPLWVFLAMGERPGVWAIAGGLVILLSITIFSIMEARETLHDG